MTKPVVIVGAGYAAGQTIVALRQGGFDGRLTLIGEEPYLPYQRPPLSKKYLAGTTERERLFIRPESFYVTHAVDVVLGKPVTRLDRAHQRLSLSDGTEIPYQQLVLATGSRPRRLNLPKADLDGICYLRSITDVDRIRNQLIHSQQIVIIGGGYIGLEVASVLTESGHSVQVLEAADRLLARVTAPQMSEYYRHIHQARGVQIHLQAKINGFVGNDHVQAIDTDNGLVECDLVIIGVGVIANDPLAHNAGLACDDGIVVDQYCRTNDGVIFAAGDCTKHPNRLLDRRIRLESVQNAAGQAHTVAKNLTGENTAYEEIPWFWSDQFDLKLQMVGLSQGHDQMVLRGRIEDNNFAMLYLREGRLIAADTVNNPREFMACRQLVRNQVKIASTQLADRDIPMKEMLN